MNAHTVGWLVLLMTLMKYLSCYEYYPFILEDEQITAVEGSCVEIKCEPGRTVDKNHGDYWFWMKDATWTEEQDFTATIIYSTDESKRPVDPLFKNRVRHISLSSPYWYRRSSKSEEFCNILICDLKKTDSGKYSFRFHGINKQWVTNPETKLTVVENPCPITFKGPQVVKENEMVTLTCSTLSSCPSYPQIDPFARRPVTQLSWSLNTESPKSVTRSFRASWKDDGIGFSCQPADKKNKYLIRNINLAVEYAPKETEARISSDHVRKGDFVTLTCSAKGRPSVSFSWFKNDQKLLSGAELKFTSIKASDSGSYFCQTENKIGTGKSNTLYIDLSSPPTNVQLFLPAKVREGQSVTVTCTAESFPPSSFTVKKSSASNPESVFPHVYGQNTSSHTFTAAPAHAGSYVCTAANSKGTARSEEKNLEVQYAPKHTAIIKGGEQQLSDGRRSVTLTCISLCYPPATYVWYKKIDDGEVFTSQSQIKTVNSDQAGEYYCTARNDLGQGSSEPIRLFEDRHLNLMKTVRPFFLVCCVLVFILLLFFLIRRWRNKSVRRGSTHTPWGFMGWWKGVTRENVISEGDLADSSRSRDELVSRPPNLLKTRRPQPRPDATSASTLSTTFYLPNRNQADYENVSVHAAKTVNPPNPCNSDSDTSEDSSSSEEDYCQAPPPQVLKRQQHGGTENESLNYVFLDFGNELKEEVVYSKVSKPKPVKERVKGRQADYENASVAQAAKSPKPSNPCDSDSDTSEDEVVVSYTQVDLKPESGHRGASRDSSSSEDELQYSQVKT